MAVFDKTESLVMMPLCSAFTDADKTDALAAVNIAKVSFQQWVGTNVACAVSHEYALGRVCQVRRLQRSRRQEGHQQTTVETVCAKVASSCPRKRKLLTHDVKELLTYMCIYMYICICKYIYIYIYIYMYLIDICVYLYMYT